MHRSNDNVTTTMQTPMDEDHDGDFSSENQIDDEDDEGKSEIMMEGTMTGDPSSLDDSSQRDEVREVERMAKGETRTVNIWRMVVGIILMGAGALVSWGTYYYLDQQLEDETVDKVITDDVYTNLWRR